MDSLLESAYSLPFRHLKPPNLRLIRPKWVRLPRPMTVFFLILISYFLICGGLIYDIIIDPPAMGSVTDANGAVRPVAFMVHRMNGQYIVEGLAASLFFVLGAIGFVILETSDPKDFEKTDCDEDCDTDDKNGNNKNVDNKSSDKKIDAKFGRSEQNIFLTTIGFMLVMISFAICWLFMLTKLPGYLQ